MLNNIKILQSFILFKFKNHKSQIDIIRNLTQKLHKSIKTNLI